MDAEMEDDVAVEMSEPVDSHHKSSAWNDESVSIMLKTIKELCHSKKLDDGDFQLSNLYKLVEERMKDQELDHYYTWKDIKMKFKSLVSAYTKALTNRQSRSTFRFYNQINELLKDEEILLMLDNADSNYFGSENYKVTNAIILNEDDNDCFESTSIDESVQNQNPCKTHRQIVKKQSKLNLRQSSTNERRQLRSTTSTKKKNYIDDADDDCNDAIYVPVNSTDKITLPKKRKNSEKLNSPSVDVDAAKITMQHCFRTWLMSQLNESSEFMDENGWNTLKQSIANTHNGQSSKDLPRRPSKIYLNKHISGHHSSAKSTRDSVRSPSDDNETEHRNVCDQEDTSEIARIQNRTLESLEKIVKLRNEEDQNADAIFSKFVACELKKIKSETIKSSLKLQIVTLLSSVAKDDHHSEIKSKIMN